MIAVMVQAALPTARAVRWRPLAVLSVMVLLVAFAARDARRPADAVLAVIAAALASGTVAALHDRADPLLAALPVSRVRRRLLRLTMVVTLAVLVWFSVTALMQPSGSSGSVAPLLALSAAGVAVGTWAPERLGVLVGALVPAAWFALGFVAGDGMLGGAATWWQSDPWIVLAVSGLALALGGRRP